MTPSVRAVGTLVFGVGTTIARGVDVVEPTLFLGSALAVRNMDHGDDTREVYDLKVIYSEPKRIAAFHLLTFILDIPKNIRYLVYIALMYSYLVQHSSYFLYR